MAKVVTLQQLHEWIKNNMHRTWSRGMDVPFENRTLELKYIRFNLDTRDMKIFSITTDGFGNHSADFRDDEKDWTILDLLDSTLKPKEKP